jgi:hypothetical protein
MISKLVVLFASMMLVSATYAQSPLPNKMKGKWFNPGSGHSNTIEAELIEMETETKAKVKVALWPYCSWANSAAELKDGAWEFTASGCRGNPDPSSLIRVSPVPGKNRMEGTYGPGGGRTVYFEW